MINLWCNLHPVKNSSSVILPQYAQFLHHFEGEKDLQSGESRLPHWSKMCRERRVERSEDVSSVGRNADSEALQKIINKLSDVRNLKDLHLKRCHMSSAQFKKRTTHLNILGKVYDLKQHVVKTCPFCNWTKPRPDRTRVSGLEAEERGDLIFLDHGYQIGDKTCPSFMSGWTHFRRILRRSVQIWPLIINMVCRHSIECTISGDFLLDHIFFGQIDYSVTDHTCPVDVESSDNEKHTSNSEWQNACGVSRG